MYEKSYQFLHGKDVFCNTFFQHVHFNYRHVYHDLRFYQALYQNDIFKNSKLKIRSMVFGSNIITNVINTIKAPSGNFYQQEKIVCSPRLLFLSYMKLKPGHFFCDTLVFQIEETPRRIDCDYISAIVPKHNKLVVTAGSKAVKNAYFYKESLRKTKLAYPLPDTDLTHYTYISKTRTVWLEYITVCCTNTFLEIFPNLKTVHIGLSFFIFFFILFFFQFFFSNFYFFQIFIFFSNFYFF